MGLTQQETIALGELLLAVMKVKSRVVEIHAQLNSLEATIAHIGVDVSSRRGWDSDDNRMNPGDIHGDDYGEGY